MSICGIYCIENNNNGKRYIGQSRDIDVRWVRHKNGLNNNKHINSHLQNSWNKYGDSSFEFSVIEEVDESVLNEREIYWIEFYKSTTDDNGYNLQYGGVVGRHTQETKDKISKSHIGIGHSEETRKKMSILSSIQCAGEGNPFYGKRHTEQTKELIRKSRLGTRLPQETIDKIRETKRGRTYDLKHSEETKAKISKASLGRTHSDETRAKMSLSKQGEGNHTTKLTEEQVIMIISMILNGKRVCNIAKEFNMSDSAVQSIKDKRSWKYLTKDIDFKKVG